jgi:D-serine dehydratase
MKEVHAEENLFLEPSAVIGFKGIDLLLASDYLKKRNIDPDKSTFIIWGTGGNLVPEKIKKEYLNL